MKYVRGFLLSLAFAGLALLAFNPHFVVRVQDRFLPAPKDASLKTLNTVPREPTKLPSTLKPDAENLPRIENFERIARHDPWIGNAPCNLDVFDAPETLRGVGPRQKGPIQISPLSANESYTIKNQPTFLYKSENGVTLKLVKPVFDYYTVSGRRFRDVQKDIFDRQPLEALRHSEAETSDVPAQNSKTRSATLAFIHSPTSLSYRLSGSRDRYQLVPKQTVLTAGFLVTLPRWTSYETASASDQAKWDDLFCKAAHHELGHLRIRLDILADTLDGYANLPPASSYEEMELLTVEYRRDISDRVQERQDAYHVYNGGGTRRGMVELPYAELPFPWLDAVETSAPEN